MVFKVDPATAKLTVLYTFKGKADGSNPWSGLVRDIQGNLYGTAAFGGAYGDGVVFEVTPPGKEKILHTFNHSDGANPTGDLIQDVWGNLYGTTVIGGHTEACRGEGCGVVFRVNPVSEDYDVLHKFSGDETADGANPTHGLAGTAGHVIYGTTENGGSPACFNSEPFEPVETIVRGCGIIFILDSTGLRPLHTFAASPDGSDPRASLIRDVDGNLYGTTFYGGAYGNGVVFKSSPGG